MKFTINSKDFLKAINKVNKVIKSRTTIPSLDNIVLELTDNDLTLKGGDGEVYLITTIECAGTESGTCAVDARTLLDAIKSLPNTGIGVVVEGSQFKCDYNSGHFEFSAEDASEYPIIEKPNSEFISISDTKPIHIASKYVADDELRPVMNGIYFDFRNGYLASSDGHKLYKSEKVLPILDDSVIMPIGCYNAIKDMDSFEMCFDGTNIWIKSGTTEVVSRIIEGRFPNYNSVIPENNIIFEIDRESLLSAVKRVSVMASDDSGLVKFEFGKSNLKLTAQDLDFSTSATEELPCRGTDAIVIGFKSTFLEQILNGMQGDIVKCELKSEQRAGVFKCDTEEIFLLMPMML